MTESVSHDDVEAALKLANYAIRQGQGAWDIGAEQEALKVLHTAALTAREIMDRDNLIRDIANRKKALEKSQRALEEREIELSQRFGE